MVLGLFLICMNEIVNFLFVFRYLLVWIMILKMDLWLLGFLFVMIKIVFFVGV